MVVHEIKETAGLWTVSGRVGQGHSFSLWSKWDSQCGRQNNGSQKWPIPSPQNLCVTLPRNEILQMIRIGIVGWGNCLDYQGWSTVTEILTRERDAGGPESGKEMGLQQQRLR